MGSTIKCKRKSIITFSYSSMTLSNYLIVTNWWTNYQPVPGFSYLRIDWLTGFVIIISHYILTLSSHPGPETFFGPRLMTPCLRGQRFLGPLSRFPVSANHTTGHTYVKPRTIMDVLPTITTCWCMVSTLRQTLLDLFFAPNNFNSQPLCSVSHC